MAIERRTSWILFLFFLLVIGSSITCIYGEIPWDEVWDGVIKRIRGESSFWNPLLNERLPRLIVILCTGASLAVSGMVMQALFQNPLASPSVLGVSCGGSLAVVTVFIFGWHILYPYSIPIAAVGGCLATLTIVYTISKIHGEVHLKNLILTGIAISTLLIAIQGALIYALRDRWQLIQTLTEWQAGTTTDRNWTHVHMQLPLTLIGLWGCWAYSREIDILALGEEEAQNLGVQVSLVRWRLFLCVSLLTGGAIATIGIVAFFGLVLPHLMRRLLGPETRKLMFPCILAGATLLLILDVILRLCHIHACSIGNVSAVLGGFFFLLLLINPQQRLVTNY